MRYCSKSLRKNSSKLGFVTMFLQVYKYFFCSKTNRRSLRWVEIGICIGRESSNVLNKICLFESCTFSLWYSLNHLKVLEKNSFDSWQYKKVCSIESGLRQKGHLSSEANLYFSSSFFVVIILCTTLKENCLSLSAFVDLYIQLTLSKTDTSGTGTKCPSQRDVRLIKSQIKGISKGRDQLYRCSFYIGVFSQALTAEGSETSLSMNRL